MSGSWAGLVCAVQTTPMSKLKLAVHGSGLRQAEVNPPGLMQPKGCGTRAIFLSEKTLVRGKGLATRQGWVLEEIQSVA